MGHVAEDREHTPAICLVLPQLGHPICNPQARAPKRMARSLPHRASDNGSAIASSPRSPSLRTGDASASSPSRFHRTQVDLLRDRLLNRAVTPDANQQIYRAGDPSLWCPVSACSLRPACAPRPGSWPQRSRSHRPAASPIPLVFHPIFPSSAPVLRPTKSSGPLGITLKIKVVKRTACGYRDDTHFSLSIRAAPRNLSRATIVRPHWEATRTVTEFSCVILWKHVVFLRRHMT